MISKRCQILNYKSNTLLLYHWPGRPIKYQNSSRCERIIQCDKLLGCWLLNVLTWLTMVLHLPTHPETVWTDWNLPIMTISTASCPSLNDVLWWSGLNNTEIGGGAVLNASTLQACSWFSSCWWWLDQMLIRGNISLLETQTETEVACAVEAKYIWTQLIQVHMQKHV